MTRPLARAGIDELEALFDKNKSDVAGLKILTKERAYRNTPRATALLAKSQRMLNVSASTANADASNSTLNTKNSAETSIQHGFEFGVPIVAAVEVPKKPPMRAPSLPVPSDSALNGVEQSSIQISTEQAYRLLKVTSASPWETVEASRRDLVARARPDNLVGLTSDECKAIQDEAKLINTAYRQLLQSRS